MPVLAQPKSIHRRKGRIDTSTLAWPKNDPERDEGYRKFVREDGPCWLPNLYQPCGRKPDRGETECAHLPYSDRHGTGLKVSDAASACLCAVHHDMLDAHVLDWQIVAFLWMKALFLRERWHRLKGKA